MVLIKIKIFVLKMIVIPKVVDKEVLDYKFARMGAHVSFLMIITEGKLHIIIIGWGGGGRERVKRTNMLYKYVTNFNWQNINFVLVNAVSKKVFCIPIT